MAKPIGNPKLLLLYPPHQAWPGYMCKPNGSLAYPSLGGALLKHGIEVEVFDACVGSERDDLDEMFYKSTELPSGLLRTGVSDERILEEVADADIVGLTSIFSDQETMVLVTAELIKKHFPEKWVICGGVNARNRIDVFLNRGVDLVCLSEAEITITRVVDEIRTGSPDFSAISGIAYRQGEQTCIQATRPDDVIVDLDRLPMPAWELLPNERYWRIARPHGGKFEPGQEVRYASMMTSLGCIFDCSYCHISRESKDSIFGQLGKFRLKSDDRVLAELEKLKAMGVKQLFIEDDTLFGNKKRGLRLIRKIRGSGFDIFDVNGINLMHLLTKGPDGSLVPDHEVIQTLIEAGFQEIALSFESANQRIITKYAAKKWNVEKSDVLSLIRVCKEYGLRITGTYMLGYPDETPEEIQNTINMAKRHRETGLDAAAFMLVMPLPGSVIFDWAVASGQFSRDFDPDRLNWSKASMIKTAIPPEQLEELRRNAWEQVNDPEWVRYKKGMNVAEPSLSP